MDRHEHEPLRWYLSSERRFRGTGLGVTGHGLNEGLTSRALFRCAAEIRSMIMVSARA